MKFHEDSISEADKTRMAVMGAVRTVWIDLHILS